MLAIIKTEVEFKGMVKAGTVTEVGATFTTNDKNTYHFSKEMLAYSGKIIPNYYDKISWCGWGWCDWMVNIFEKPTIKMIETLYKLPNFD